QHDGFDQEQPANSGDGVARCSKNSNLAETLFDAQLEKQQREQQGRHDQEEAEVREVLAKVGGAARRLERGSAGIHKGDADRLWRGGRQKLTAQACSDDLGVLAMRDLEPDRRGLAVWRSPQLASALVCDEGLRCRLELVPIAFVLASDT